MRNQNRIALTKQLIRAKNSSQSSEIINNLESQMFALILKEAEGAKIRSRAQWFGGRHIIFGLEQTLAASIANSFSCLFDENGIEKNSQQG